MDGQVIRPNNEQCYTSFVMIITKATTVEKFSWLYFSEKPLSKGKSLSSFVLFNLYQTHTRLGAMQAQTGSLVTAINGNIEPC